MSIDCAFFAFLRADAEPRTSAAGKRWVRMRVGVGRDEAVRWVSVSVFERAAEVAAGLKKMDRVTSRARLSSTRGVATIALSVTSCRLPRSNESGPPHRSQSSEEAIRRCCARTERSAANNFHDDESNAEVGHVTTRRND